MTGCGILVYCRFFLQDGSPPTIIHDFKLVSSKRNEAVKTPCDLFERLWYPKPI
jgi:hypothetical protein